MEFSAENSLILVGLLAAAAALLATAQLVRIPYPILRVLGGLGLGLVPGMPRIELAPDLVLVAILPPLLYGTAFFTSLRELRANVRPITLLAGCQHGYVGGEGQPPTPRRLRASGSVAPRGTSSDLLATGLGDGLAAGS